MTGRVNSIDELQFHAKRTEFAVATPVPAVKQALDRAGWQTSDIQRIEINEAFAAIAIAVAKDLGINADVVNVEGGAIAHGHPIGASGAVLTTRLLHSMHRDAVKKGIVTLCIGGGQGSRSHSKRWSEMG